MDIVAAVTTGPHQPFELKTVQLDPPRGDEILVRIVGVGVCHTDLVFRDNNYIAAPAVLGHEGSGIIEAVGGGVTKVAPGDRVVITFRSCGGCRRCAAGDPAYCETMPKLNYTGARPDGSRTLSLAGAPVGGSFFGQSSFATYALTYERNVVKVPDDLPLHLMGPLTCGVQTGTGAVLRSLACTAGSSLLVTGAGPVGLSAVMAAVISGCRTVIAAEPHTRRLGLAKEFGATHAFDPTGEDLAVRVRAICPEGVDYALDTTGVPAVQNAAINALAVKGVFGIVGVTPRGSPPPGDANDIMQRGITIRGIVEGDSDPDHFLPELMAYHRDGRLPFDRMITTFPLAAINEAIATQHRGECAKVVLVTPTALVAPTGNPTERA
jgi:aryl-alcohol dehydrogenase